MSSVATLPPLSARHEQVRPAIPWWLVAVGILLALAHLPLLAFHARQLWMRPHYQFFPFVLAGAAVLGIQRLRGLGPLRPGTKTASYLFLAACWGLLALAGLFFSPWLGAVAALATLAALIFGLGGNALLRQLFLVWAFLWLLIPPPFGFDQKLVSALQTLTARCGSGVLDAFGVHHLLAGHVVETGERRFLVEEACSGIYSFFAVLPVTLFFVLWVRRRLLHAVLLISAAVGWMMAANVARVVGITVLATWWNIDVSAGWPHEAFGLLAFAVTLGLIASTDRLLLFFFAAVPESPRPGLSLLGRHSSKAAPPPGSREPTRLPDRRQTVLTGWPVVGAFGLLAGLQLWLFWATPSEAGLFQVTVAVTFPELGEEALPAQWGAWQRQAYKFEQRGRADRFGEFSQSWQYTFGRRSAVVSLDYAFTGWHELTVCYEGNGWKVQDYGLHREADAEGAGGCLVEAKLSKSADHLYLLFSLFDPQGRLLEPTGERAFGDQLKDRLADLGGALGRADGKGPSPRQVVRSSYQVQLVIESYDPLTPAEQAEAQAFFRHVRSTLPRPRVGAPEGSP